MSAAIVETQEFSAKDVALLDFTNQTGTVKISGETTNKVIIKSEKIDNKSKCEVKYRQSGRTLEVEGGKTSLLSQASCVTNFTIIVPKNTDLQIRTLSGDIEVRGTRGDVDVKIGKGNLIVHSMVEELHAIAGKGSIDIEGLTGNADLKVGSGDINLTYAKDPVRGELDIKVGSGNASVHLPSKMRVHTRFLAGSGEFYSELGNYQDAKFHVAFKSGSGNLFIKSANSPKNTTSLVE